MSIKKKYEDSDKVRSSGKNFRSSTNKVNETKKRNRNRKNAIPSKRSTKIVKLKSKMVNYSICIPTTIISACHNLEQITHTVYQIAKAATIFNVAEIVLLEIENKEASRETQDKVLVKTGKKKIKFNEKMEINCTKNENSIKKKRLSPGMLILSLLQFFVTPPYLVNSVFKKEYRGYFKIASKLPRLTTLPFMRYLKDDRGRYREGLAIRMSKPGVSNKNKTLYEQTKYINIGKDINLELKNQLIPVNVRVTVDTIEKKVVSPDQAYGDFVGAKSSYGYHVRLAKSFKEIFTQSPFSEGYTQTVWVNSGDFYYNPDLKQNMKIHTKIPLIKNIIKPSTQDTHDIHDIQPEILPTNLLSVFGKWKDILESFENSRHYFEGVEGPFQFFDGQLDLPGTTPDGFIRIEDSCMIALTTLTTY